MAKRKLIPPSIGTHGGGQHGGPPPAGPPGGPPPAGCAKAMNDTSVKRASKRKYFLFKVISEVQI